MASHSYYEVDERTRRSVMAAQEIRSVNEVHESRRARFSRLFDQSAFLATISKVEAVVEGICLNGTNGWSDVSRLQPGTPRLSSRLIEGNSVPPVLLGHDRATLSLYDPIQNLGEMCDSFHSQVIAWATKATYFSEVSNPMIVRNINGSTSETETAKTIREALEFVGTIDRAYVKRFRAYAQSMVEPLAELRTLEGFIASILLERYEITVVDSKQKKMEATANPHDGVPSGDKGLTALAQYADGTDKKSSQPPEKDLKQNAASKLKKPGSSSCEPPDSKPSFPVDATNLPALALALPYLTLEETSRDPKSSCTLQERSSLYDTKPDDASPRTPQWKIDLSERKGHRIHLLHVGDSELDILAKCLSYLYNATSKAEECFDFIMKKGELAKEMQKEFEHWAGACEYLEETFGKATKGKKSTKKGGIRLEYNDDDDFNERRRRSRARTPLSGSRYVPDTVDLDTAMGYAPPEDASANTSGYHQLQIAALSSHPPPSAQQQPRRQPSIIDLENYDLDFQPDSRSATPTPTHHTESPSSSLLSLENISISSPSDFGTASPSSTEDEGSEGSEDSDRTIRQVVSPISVGEGVRRWLGSPVPFADVVDDDMNEEHDDGGSDDSESTLGGRAGVVALGRGAYTTIGSALGGMATTTTTTAAAAQNDEAANNVHDNASADEKPAEPRQPRKFLLGRNGKRLGLYGEEL